jgi:purine-binding chemotaxis protein CheW
MTQFATFKLDDRLFGLDLLVVREINQNLDITPVPKANSNIRGLINLRGQIVTIIDLAVKLGMSSKAVSRETHNIILKTEAELAAIHQASQNKVLHTCVDQVGFLVDSIGDVVEANEDQIEPPSANVNEAEGRFLAGVLRSDHGLLVLLNLKQVLKQED